jgi:hypothetical protein
MKRKTARKLAVSVGLCATLLGGMAYAEHKDIDLKDYDDDLMHDVDRVLKFFEPDITAGNAVNALDDAGVIRDGFTYSKSYFSKKGNAEDAVKIAQDGLDLVASIEKSVEAKDFSGAATLARQVPNTCKACHEIYKPRNK